MKMVIICPYISKVEGTVEYYKNGKDISLNYTLHSHEKELVLRMWALSSKRPFNMPVKVHIPLFDRGCATAKCVVDEKTLAMYGYNPEDIDTFALTYNEGNNIRIAGAGFALLRWNISYPFDRISNQSKNTTMHKGVQVLENIKKSKGQTGDYSCILRCLKMTDNKLLKSEYSPLPEYRWYEYCRGVSPLNLSIYNHLVSTREFAKTYQNNRILLWGVKDINHTALALKTKGQNPFVNAEDCAIYCNGFWIVGINLKNDGQYFERIEI